MTNATRFSATACPETAANNKTKRTKALRMAKRLPKGGNTGSEECRGCAIDGAIATTRDLMQTTKSQSPSRQDPVNGGHSERQNRAGACISTFETRDAFSKLGNGSRGRRYTHLTLETRKACDMFYICSRLG